ncbi:MAG TPA: hypothetical protein VME66_12940, partial [Candidatus Acidoferrales bacterium]|nr:hypothetical protein [Candidatus Acidoferrales bacterium]
MWLRLKNPLKALLVAALVAFCLYLVLPIQQKVHLGLDLQGGLRVLLQLECSPEVPTITRDVQAEVVQVIDNRINGMGVTEPVITTVGNNRLLVELPNVKDPDQALQELKDVAKLDFKIVPPQVVERAEA